MPSGLLNLSRHGSDVVIGLLDTGVWPESQSFNDIGLPEVPRHWRGECIEGEPFSKSMCNRKLVGARHFTAGHGRAVTVGYNSTHDSQGHGTHTSTTAAGSPVQNASLFQYASGRSIGIASKARIAMYKVCWPSVGCSSADIVAAYDQAVEDGVDVISFSISSFVTPYHLDPVSIAQFGAMERGVFVAASAGNEGPSAGSVNNISPWVTTVGAGSMDRDFPAHLILGDGTVIDGPSVYVGPKLGRAASAFFPLVPARDLSQYNSALCIPGSLDTKMAKGKIVVCENGGGYTNTLKGEVVKNASGVAMVLSTVDDEGDNLIAEAHVLPALYINSSNSEILFNYLAASKYPRATLAFLGTEMHVKPAPTVVSFSSRGPNAISPHIAKPDLIAPGLNILAAWPENVSPSLLSSDRRRSNYNIQSGTSMACPHIAGVAPLLKGAHPNWPPSRIKSALMTTAYVINNAGGGLLDEATQLASNMWVHGSGHVDPEKASDPGLVFDITAEDYIDFLCASSYKENEIAIITGRWIKCKKGINAWNINYPSIAVSLNQKDKLKSVISVSRTVTHVGEGAAEYEVETESPRGVIIKVDPSKMIFNQTEERLSFVVRISVSKFELEKYSPESLFAKITWKDGKHVVSVPIAVTVLP